MRRGSVAYTGDHQPTKKNTGAVFVRVDCVEWLLAYGADELRLQGVTPMRVVQAAPQAGNCAAVAGLHLEFDFNATAWWVAFGALNHPLLFPSHNHSLGRSMTLQPSCGKCPIVAIGMMHFYGYLIFENLEKCLQNKLECRKISTISSKPI